MKKAFIGGLIGLIAGLAGGYFVGGYRCSRVYKDRIMELEEENEKLIEETSKIEIKAVSEAPTDISEPKIEKSENEDKKMYIRKIEAYVDPDEEDDLIDSKSDFRIISEDDFVRDVNYRDNETLTWYSEDKILVDSADMPIHDEEDVIGIAALEVLEENDEDLEVLYVSNNIEDKMYEIIVDDNLSYYRDIIGG